MGKCPNCGKGGFFDKTVKCKVCGKEGCEKCLRYILTIRGTDYLVSSGYLMEDWDHWYVCSENCSKELASSFADGISPKVYVDVDFEIKNSVLKGILAPRNEKFVGDKLGKKIEALKRRFPDDILRLNHMGLSWTQGSTLDSDYSSVLKANPFYQALVGLKKQLVMNSPLETRARELELAKDLEKTRRFEDAARIYEGYGMYEEAGKVRAKGQEFTVKRTDLSIDINKLLQQVRDGGLVVVYRCPSCGANLKIGKNATVESLRTCQYCGSEIKAIDLADFLKTALS